MTSGTVVILAPVDDVHALAVQKHVLQRQKPCFIVSTADYPAHLCLSDWIGGDDDGEIYLSKTGDVVRWAHIQGVWRRRIRNHNLPQELVDQYDQEVSRRDTRSGLDGFVLRLASQGTTVINDPRLESPGLNKAYQLECARAVGLGIPQTLISNNETAVRSFVRALQEGGRKSVFKGFNCPRNFFIATQLFKEGDFDRLGALEYAPAIFQEYVAGRNLRITAVGDHLFAAEVILENQEAEYDWRLQHGNRVVPFVLDPKTTSAVHKLMARLGLIYGAIDLKLRSDGTPVFLEVNPWGQYLFVEIQTGQQISAAIAMHLMAAESQIGLAN